MAAKSKTLAARARNQVNAYIKTLVDGKGNQILPRTRAKAVMTEGGVTAEEKFAEIAAGLGGISTAVAKARPNVTGTYPVAAGQTVAAGDVVDVQADGTVGKTVAPVANVETVYKNATITGNGVCMLTNTLGVVCYGFSDSGQAVVINVVDGKVVPASNICTFQSGEVSNVSCARLSDTKFVAGYAVSNAPYFAVCEVSGTTIYCAKSSRLIDKTSNCAVVPLSEELFLAVFNDSGLTAAAYSVSGITASVVSSRVCLPGNTASNHISATRLPDDSSGNKRVCVCFVDAGDGNKGKAAIVTIDSANVVTWGTVVTFNDGTAHVSCCLDEDAVIASFFSTVAPGGYFVVPLMINGDKIILGDRVNVYNISSGHPNSINAIDGQLVGIYALPSASGTAYLMKRTGTSISVISDYLFQTGGLPAFISAEALPDHRVIIAYSDTGNSNYGTATILEVFGDRIAGSFVNESSQCIALQSGESGREVEVIFDGVAELPGAVKGQTIVSPGVYGVAVLPGVLQVWSKDRPGQVVTGSYVGTGTAGSGNPNTLTFDFVPKIVFIHSTSSANVNGGFAWVNGAVRARSSTDSVCRLTWNEKTLSWYSETSQEGPQLNNKSEVYNYVALG